MVDVLTPEQRWRNMSRVRGKDTRPELKLRRGLHGRGLRFRLQRRDLPGRPDVVFPRYRVCLFVHGCFWHGHGCPLFRMPATREEFWRTKIEGNRQRDHEAVDAFLEAGWRVLVVWECAIKGPGRLTAEELFGRSAEFVKDPGLQSQAVVGRFTA